MQVVEVDIRLDYDPQGDFWMERMNLAAPFNDCVGNCAISHSIHINGDPTSLQWPNFPASSVPKHHRISLTIIRSGTSAQRHELVRYSFYIDPALVIIHVTVTADSRDRQRCD